MNMLTLIRSLRTRATSLEADAAALRAEADQLSALVLGEDAPGAPAVTPVPAPAVAAPAVAPVAPVAAPEAPKAAKPPLPSKADIQAKAAQYGVDISEFMPAGAKPTDLQKQNAIRKIGLARRAQEAAATLAPEVVEPEVVEPEVSLSALIDLTVSDD